MSNRVNLNESINNLIGDWISEYFNSTQDTQWQTKCKLWVFEKFTGIDSMQIGESAIDSILLEFITDQIDRANDALFNLSSLREELRDDILDRYDNRDNWDDQLVRKHIEAECGDDFDVDALCEVIYDQLDNISSDGIQPGPMGRRRR